MTSPLPRRLQLVNRDALIVERCRGRRVLHLGCSDSPDHIEHQKAGRLLHEKLVGKASYLCGVDIDREALEWVTQHCGGDEMLLGSIEDTNFMSTLKERNFDVILLTDVLEHVNNAHLALRNIRLIASDNTRFIVAVPNAYNLKGFLRIALGYEIINYDHVAFHSFYTLINLLKRADWQPENHFTYPGGGTGLAARVTNAALRFVPAWAEGIGVVAKPGNVA